MFDIGFLEQILVDLAFAGRIENLFLDLGVDRQLEADLLRELPLAAVAAGLLELLEQFLDLAVILLEQRDRVLLFSAMTLTPCLVCERNQLAAPDVPGSA